MVVALGSVQPVFKPLKTVPDGSEDKPAEGLAIPAIGELTIPSVVLGAATFSGFYNSEEDYSSAEPVRTVRLALRYGICGFDTSPYYGPSEIVLGNALKAVADEFPRESYKIITKCGRYGFNIKEFDYSGPTIRASIERSLARMHTTYLDAVYLHDAEFVCEQVGPLEGGNPHEALASQSAEYGLAPGQEGKIWGPGDERILEGIAELRKLQEEGKVKAIGISALPLPVLLRLALLVLHKTGKPLDIMLSYTHVSLQNSLFATHFAAFKERAKVRQLLTASPLCMGLLTPRVPTWHPASDAARATATEAHALLTGRGWAGGLPELATGFAFRKGEQLGMPVVIGLSTVAEVHQCVAAWRRVREAKDTAERDELEKTVADMFGDMQGYMWQSPEPKALLPLETK
ncbi:Aldo/keto reductase [Epithele typhae]|uniref:Aldo/keto reductase n=1 Tax=Epithele typhae TaxID=378194 RepID=UPI002007F9D2|nr:Aldo/keto reductase [Epithele typhae]KAH9943009.1 Aldo/keto reductase [Epithele typhae]